MKASARLMSPSEREFCAAEIKDLLTKELIEPSKSPWACRAFVVNKHSEIKRAKPRLVVNYKPLSAVLQKVRYPLPNKASLLQRLVVQSSISLILNQDSIRLVLRQKISSRQCSIRLVLRQKIGSRQRSWFHMVSTSGKCCHSRSTTPLSSFRNA